MSIIILDNSPAFANSFFYELDVGSEPRYVAVDSLGNFYVSSEFGGLEKFDSDGNPVESFSDSECGGCPTNTIFLNDPFGVAVDIDGNIFVADNFASSAVHKFDSSGVLDTSFAGDGILDSTDGDFFTNPILSAIAVDGQGNVYVTDMFNGEIRKYDSFGNLDTSFGTSGILSVLSEGIAVDPLGHLYLTVLSGTVEKRDSDGNLDITFGSGGVFADPGFDVLDPTGIAVDPAGNIYVVNDDGLNPATILKIERDGFSAKIIEEYFDALQFGYFIWY